MSDHFTLEAETGARVLATLIHVWERGEMDTATAAPTVHNLAIEFFGADSRITRVAFYSTRAAVLMLGEIDRRWWDVRRQPVNVKEGWV